MRSYKESYLYDAQNNLAEAFDYCVNTLYFDLDKFMDLFIASSVCSEFENGSPKVVSGMSGIELVQTVLKDVVNDFPSPITDYDRSKEYWAGWILAYYQWYTAQPFKYIKSFVSMNDIVNMYYPLHEANEQKFVDTIINIIKDKSHSSRLQQKRKELGLTQKELAELAGINLRTLQQYENKSKDINKAAVETVLVLAKVLYCDINEIIEYI